MEKCLRIFMTYVLIFFSTSLLANNLKNTTNPIKNNTDTIQPEYPGGIDEFRRYIADNIRYPLLSEVKGIKFGKIVATFVIDTSGNLIEPRIKKGLNKAFNIEVLKVLAKSEKWKSGSIKNEKKNIVYLLPIRLSPPEIDLKGANTIWNGEFITAKNLKNKLQNNFIGYQSFSKEFSKALLGQKYNQPLISIQEPNKLAANPKSLATTLNSLKHIDTTKFDLYYDGQIMDYYAWSKFLDINKTANIAVHNLSSKPNKIGQVILYSNEGALFVKNTYYQQLADKQSFLDMIDRHRNGNKTFTDMLIYVDDYPFQTQWLLDSMNINIINHVIKTPADKVKDIYKDPRKNGYYQIYTRDFAPQQQINFRNTLSKIIDEKQSGKNIDENYYFFINNEKSDSDGIIRLGLSNISLVHIIDQQRAKDLFGQREDKSIIYVFAK